MYHHFGVCILHHGFAEDAWFQSGAATLDLAYKWSMVFVPANPAERPPKG
jgi:hypothetical protein